MALALTQNNPLRFMDFMLNSSGLRHAEKRPKVIRIIGHLLRKSANRAAHKRQTDKRRLRLPSVSREAPPLAGRMLERYRTFVAAHLGFNNAFLIVHYGFSALGAFNERNQRVI